MRFAGILAVLIGLGLAAPAAADVRVPPEERDPVQVSAPLVIKRGALRGVAGNVQAKVVIPRHMVQAPAGPGAAAPAAQEMGALPTSYGTWIAGIALSLAAVSLIFVVRGNRKTKTVAAALLAAALTLGGYGVASADIPVPRGPQIVIELVEEGESVTLFLPR